MDAQTLPASPLPAVTPETLQRAITSEPMLRAIAAPPQGGWTSLAALLEAAGRDPKNSTRDISRMDEAGFITRADAKAVPSLTPLADAALAAIDRATGAGETVSSGERPTHARHGQIAANPNQPRKHFDDEALDELADSIHAHGQLQNILVRPHPQPAPDGARYQIVGGERRWRAVGRLIERGAVEIDFPIRIEVRELTDEQVAVLALVENLQRQDLDFMERALGFKALHKDFGWATAKIAEENRVSQKTVQLAITFAEATDGQVKAVRDGEKTYRQVLKEIAQRPKPIELTATQWLIIAEVLVAGSPTEGVAYYRKADCDREAALAGISEAGLCGFLEVTGPDYETGQYRVQLENGWVNFDRLVPQMGSLDPANRATTLLGLRAKALGADAAEDAAGFDGFVTPWLNGPFELTEEGRARKEATAVTRKDQADAQAAATIERDQRRQELAKNRERSSSLLKRLTVFDPVIAEPEREEVLAIMEATDAGLPWIYRPGGSYGGGRLLDRHGNIVNLEYADSADVRLQMIMATMNAAGGFAPVIETPAPDQAADAADTAAEDDHALDEELSEPAFWAEVRAYLLSRYEVDEQNLDGFVNAIRGRLYLGGEDYGQEGYTVTRLDAQCVVDGYLEDHPEILDEGGLLDPAHVAAGKAGPSAEDPEALGEFEEDGEGA